MSSWPLQETLPTIFITFFCSVAPNIKSNIKQILSSFHYYLTNPCKDSFIKSLPLKKKYYSFYQDFMVIKQHE